MSNIGSIMNTNAIYNVNDVNDDRTKKLMSGAWINVMPLKEKGEKPKIEQYPTIYPGDTGRSIYASVTHPLDFLWTLINDGFNRSIGLLFKNIFAPKAPKAEKVFDRILANYMGTTGIKPDVLMGYMKWYDGWDFTDFPKLFCDECYKRGITPFVTWEVNFKRDYVAIDKNGKFIETETFLDEFNRQITDKKSDLYKYVVKFADSVRDYKFNGKTRQVYLRVFHEFNMGFAYAWTMYMNGEKDAPAKFIAAWRNLYDIFQQEHATNAVFVWCPEAHPPVEDTPILKSSWNSFGAGWPGDAKVGSIGFDIYQRVKERDFNDLFAGPHDFMRNHSKIPAGICEASTYNEYFRVDFINKMYEAADNAGLKFVIWFNEYKGLDNWRIDAKLKPESGTELRIEDLQEAGDDLNAMSGFTNTAPKELKTNDGLVALRAALKIHTRSLVTNITINKDAVNEDITNDGAYYMSEFKLKMMPSAYSKALFEWRQNVYKDKLKSEIKGYYFLRDFPISLINNCMTNSLSNKAPLFTNTNGEWEWGAVYKDSAETRLRLAKTYEKSWAIDPEMYDCYGTTDYQEALKMLDKNVMGAAQKGDIIKIFGSDSSLWKVFFVDPKNDVMQFDPNIVDIVKTASDMKAETKDKLFGLFMKNMSVSKIEVLKAYGKNDNSWRTLFVNPDRGAMRFKKDVSSLPVKLLDAINVSVTETVSKDEVLKIFGDKDESWKKFFLNPDEESLMFNANTVSVILAASCMKTDSKTAFMNLMSKNLIEGPAKIFNVLLPKDSHYYTREYILSLVKKKDMLAKYFDMYLNATSDSKNGEGKYYDDIIPQIYETSMTILKALDYGQYLKQVNYSNPILSRREVLGTKASVLVSLGDVCMLKGMMPDIKKMEQQEDENKELYSKAMTYYTNAKNVLAEKEKWSGLRETYLNIAIDIGLARVKGLSAEKKEDLDDAVLAMSKVVKMKLEEVDPGLIIKAKLYLAELLAHYYYLNGVDDSEIKKNLKIAYEICADLEATELSYQAKKTEEKIMKEINGKKGKVVF